MTDRGVLTHAAELSAIEVTEALAVFVCRRDGVALTVPADVSLRTTVEDGTIVKMRVFISMGPGR